MEINENQKMCVKKNKGYLYQTKIEFYYHIHHMAIAALETTSGNAG
jgi:hypothetical protein